ncbi:hypothetical protein MMC32_001726 [Xylographa parallela]|nr:hypothetical protein [Xylographa parallela]
MKRRRPNSPDRGTPLRRSSRLWKTDIEASRLRELCNYCKLLKIRESPVNKGLYQRTLKEISQSVDKGCKMCRFLTRRFTNFSDSAQDHPDDVWSLSISQYEEAYGNNRRPTQVTLMLNHHKTNLKYDICRLPSTFTGQALNDFVRTYEEEHPQVDHGHLGYFPRLVEREPLSDATIALVRDWLRTCTNHAFCRAQKDQPLPKRLIDVRSNGKVMLIEPKGETGRYLALSHCWGSVDDAFSTTKDNIAKRISEGIEICKLPKNFQDATAFTRRLGYHYLWIDSLCILQHDQDDWACEASKMAWYYSNAILTLVVADAFTCHVGFLSVRNHSTSPSIPGEGEEYYCLREALREDCDLNMTAPISRRAWTLQERLISPRVVHFTRDQLLWHCREDEWAEGYVHNTHRSHNEFRLGCQKAGHFIDREEGDAYWRSRSSDPDYKPFFDTEFAAETWYNCVSEYTTRSLSMPSDKLAAISGLAEKYAVPELGQYLAGLWEQDIFRGLAWTRVKTGERSESQYMSYIAIKAKRTLAARSFKPPLLYRAPSWSWASVNGPVEIPSSLFYFVKRGASAGMQYEVKHWGNKYGPRLVSHDLRHSRQSPYLDIEKGSSIQVEGYCRRLWVSKTKLSSTAIGPKGPFIKEIVFDNDQPEELFCYLEKPRQLERVWKELLVLQICKQRTGLRLVYGLLLEKMHGTEDAYMRVGIVELACYNLCNMMKGPSTGFTYYMHPTQQRFRGISKAHYKTKEWQKDRWQKRTIKLF